MSEPEPESERRVPPKRAKWFAYTDASSIGIEMAVAVCFGAIGGYYVERYLTHWSPWTMLLGFTFGVVVAARAVLRTARSYEATLRRDAEAPDDSDAESPPTDK